jgi:Ca-activated chloride channel family protein
MKAPSAAGYACDSITFVLLTLVCAGTVVAGAQFSSGVSVVEVYASVTDARGEPVRGLDKADFLVSENGVPQEIAVFAAGDFPLSVAVALDRSFSMAGSRLAVAKSAARTFLGELRPEDEAAVLAIGSQVETAAPLSPDRQAQFEALSRIDAFGTTGLYDAVIAAIDITQAAKGRRALVLLSDGRDRYSGSTADAALEHARRSDVMVYPIALGRTASPFLEELAARTGGRAFHLQDPGQLADRLRRIARELRFQYLLGYAPAGSPAASGAGWRRIEVRVTRPGATVRAREGYLAKQQAPEPAPSSEGQR